MCLSLEWLVILVGINVIFCLLFSYLRYRFQKPKIKDLEKHGNGNGNGRSHGNGRGQKKGSKKTVSLPASRDLTRRDSMDMIMSNTLPASLRGSRVESRRGGSRKGSRVKRRNRSVETLRDPGMEGVYESATNVLHESDEKYIQPDAPFEFGDNQLRCFSDQGNILDSRGRPRSKSIS